MLYHGVECDVILCEASTQRALLVKIVEATDGKYVLDMKYHPVKANGNIKHTCKIIVRKEGKTEPTG